MLDFSSYGGIAEHLSRTPSATEQIPILESADDKRHHQLTTKQPRLLDSVQVQRGPEPRMRALQILRIHSGPYSIRC